MKVAIADAASFAGLNAPVVMKASKGLGNKLFNASAIKYRAWKYGRQLIAAHLAQSFNGRLYSYSDRHLLAYVQRLSKRIRQSKNRPVKGTL